MSLRHLIVPLFLIVAVGCGESEDAATATADPAAAETTSDESTSTDDSTAEAAAGTETALTAENTTITFVGSHIVETPPDPEARTGSFKDLAGSATIADGVLQKLSVEIDVASLSTGNEKLDNHLKSPDFFDVRENPTATFQSTEISTADNGMVLVKGELTMLKAIKPVEFEAEVNAADGLELKASFEIDRTEFGMDYGKDKLEAAVQMTVSVVAK